MTESVRFAMLEAIPLAVIRRTARQPELSAVVRQCCGLVWEAVRAQGLKGGRNVAVYLTADIQLEVGVEMAVPFEETGEVVKSATPAGPAVSITHIGPYQTLGRAHEAIHSWCRANGRRLAGPSWEIYGHWQQEWNDDPSRIRTEVFYSVA